MTTYQVALDTRFVSIYTFVIMMIFSYYAVVRINVRCSYTEHCIAICEHVSGPCFNCACLVWRHGSFPTTSSVSPTPTAAISGYHHLGSWWSDVSLHGCPLLAIMRFRWLEAASRTVCRQTSPQPQRWLFLYPPQNLSLFPDHFLPPPVWGRGTPLFPLSIYFLIFSHFYFSLSFIGFTYFLFCPSLSFLPE